MACHFKTSSKYHSTNSNKNSVSRVTWVAISRPSFKENSTNSKEICPWKTSTATVESLPPLSPMNGQPFKDISKVYQLTWWAMCHWIPNGHFKTISRVELHQHDEFCSRRPNQWQCSLLSVMNKWYTSGIVNLSKYTLQDPEISVLSKGLGFCPTPGAPDIGDIIQDLDNFKRKTRIQLFFTDPNQGSKPETIPSGGPFEHRSFKL